MKEEINIMQKREKGTRPVISLSVTNLDIKVEEGKVYRDSFFIESENNVPIQGNIYSTNDKVGLEVRDLDGVRQEIPFYFKGKLAIRDNEYQGDFVLITNGGEYNIPYTIRVVKKCVETSIGPISKMSQFVRLYKENRKEAMDLFFMSSFEDVFLKGEDEKKVLYHGMMKSRSRSMILEEFLTAAGYKPRIRLQVEDKRLVLDVGKDQDTLKLSLSGPGYLEGRVFCDKGQVQLSHERFNSDEFVDGEFILTIEKNKNFVMGSDVIHIRTVRQSFDIPVEWWGTLPALPQEREKKLRMRRQKAELMHNYLYFRTGSIGFEDFAGDSEHLLDDMILETGDICWKLYKMHLHLMQTQIEAAKQTMDEIDKSLETEKMEPLAENYYLYLKAMYYRTPEAISKAVMAVREFYETSDYKAESLWMLIYLDREYVYNKKLQYDTIRQLFEEGHNSFLLYFEACEILNENPNYMEELNPFEISIFRWGVRYGYVSMALSYQFARLALKLKYYNNAVYHIAEKLYDVQPEEIFLHVICSLLIKGNRTGKEFHRFFRDAVNANLKLIGLNEFFIRSMDFDQFEIIPQRVLIYFTYSNSLDYNEKAYLYTNVLEHKDEYDEVFGAYYSKMLPFVEEQLLKGRINEHLALLYTHFQKEILDKPENWKSVCDILFFRKLTCNNPNMVGVYVNCPETGDEKYYPLSGGVTYLEYYNHRTICYFVDSAEQRYVEGIDYTMEEFLKLMQFPKSWVEKNLSNKKVLLVRSGIIDEYVEADELMILKRIVFNSDYAEWMQKRSMEQLLIYYENHQNKEELVKWLDRIDYSNITPTFRKTIMDYYIEAGMLENAYFGVELYGSGMMRPAKQLKLACFGIDHNEGQEDETALSLAYAAFMRKKYNRLTLGYLMKYFKGEMEDLLLIWERSRKFQLATTDFEEKILRQSMFTQNDSDGIFPVYSSLYEARPEAEVACRYLEYASMKELEGSLDLPDYMHEIIGREIKSGRITDRRTKIHYLYYFADKPDWHEKIREAVVCIVDEFMEDEFYLPIYHIYGEWLEFPIYYEEMTFLTYEGNSGANVTLHYEIEGEEDSYREIPLREVLPGFYVCHMHFFQRDHVNYRLEEDGVHVEDRDRLFFETFAYEGDDSRFFALNHLDMQEADSEELAAYLLKAYFVDHVVKEL